ncbi:MAG: IS21 family transposase, partial [Desulfosarcina sp.]
SPRASKLDPFKSDIVRLLQAHPYTAIQLLQRLREQGFEGGYSIVKEYVRKVRPPKTRAFLTLSFAPGECAQVDWGSFGAVNVGSTRRRLSFFVMVLCYSRLMYVTFTASQTMEHFLGCHQDAFEYFGLVPHKIMVDNLKSAVLKRIVGQAPVFNPKYLDFANHYGFSIAACNVGRGNEKGRVENGVGYVKKNLLAGLEIPDFAAIHPAARHWLDTVANVRIHGETRERPIDRFEKERPNLNPLPRNRFDIATVSQVRASSQFRVAVDANRYSVPAEYAGCALTLKTYPDRICLYNDNKLIARHTRSYDRHQDIEDPDHPKQLLLWRKKAREQKIVMRFLTLSPKSAQYYQKLEQRRMNPYHHVQKIVALSEIYDLEAVARALEDAFTFQAFSCEYIANLLEQRTRRLPEPGALHLTRREDLLDLKVESPDLTIYHKEQP